MTQRIKHCLLIILIGCGGLLCSCNNNSGPRILVFSKTNGYHHTSIPAGIRAIQQIGKENGYAVDTTTDATMFNDAELKKYRAVVFNNTTGNVLNAVQQAAFERYIQAGGGFAGIHAAADTEYDWPWYGKLVGARFASHPLQPNERKALIHVTDQQFPAARGLPRQWERTDEWYNFSAIFPGIHVIATLDENSYEGGTNGANHPVSWYHAYDGGRAFYTALGHTGESYREPLFLQHLSGGIKYVMGDGKPLDYGKAYTKVVPDQGRFVKTVLKDNLNSPMELTIAKDGRIFFSELFGNLYEYDPRTGQTLQRHRFYVTTTGGMGLLGISLDPGFAENHFMYAYYAPGEQTTEPLLFRLSRFTLNNDGQPDTTSEKVMLQVPVQKNSGSHHGGSMAWDKNGNLYLSTGDGTAPFPAEGYAPLDERPGPEHYSLDSQRGAGNTNDYKGKILRIHPEKDGTYTIPAGNLFPPGTDSTKPEIYIMGVRNPYRIAVNPVTSVLYWGDIGPDAGADSERGPKGYDEFNQARKAGNFGWPYFVANNQAYARWDFEKKTAGPRFDTAHPVNNSPNNTGLKNLPPAMPAMIWYPYDASVQFPELGTGGRSAMAGDFYEYNKENTFPGKFPEYYHNTLFVFDWMRNWVMDLRFNKEEQYKRNEPFMAANGDFSRPIDLAFGPNGAMYMLEYGTVYGAANPDARLVRITYNDGNRPPVAIAGIVDTAVVHAREAAAFLTSDLKDIPMLRSISGQAPLKVNFSGKNSKDLDDDDEINVQWLFDGKTPGASTITASYTYTKPGVYHAILQVHDRAGLMSADTLIINVGNTMPQVKIITKDNRSFYRSHQPFHYEIKVTDKEDTFIDPARIRAYYTWHALPVTKVYRAGDQDLLTDNAPGANIINNNDCKSCHSADKKAVGPAYTDIARRYSGKNNAAGILAGKVIRGGAGNWGTDLVMSAHPQLSPADAKTAVEYILSLANHKAIKTEQEIPIPLKGTLQLPYHPGDPQGRYTIRVSYTDNGGAATEPLEGHDEITLRKATIPAVFMDAYNGFPRFRNNLSEGGHKSWLLLKDTDLNGIREIACRYSSVDASGEVEIRAGSLAGPVIGRAAYKPTGNWNEFRTLVCLLQKKVTGKHNVYIIAIKRERPNEAIIRFNEIQFNQ